MHGTPKAASVASASSCTCEVGNHVYAGYQRTRIILSKPKVCQFQYRCHNSQEKETFQELGYKLENKFYVLADPAAEAFKLTAASKAEEAAKAAAERAKERKGVDSGVKQKVISAFLKALAQESLRHKETEYRGAVFGMKSGVRTEIKKAGYFNKGLKSLVDVRVTVARTEPLAEGGAEITVETFLKDEVFNMFGDRGGADLSHQRNGLYDILPLAAKFLQQGSNVAGGGGAWGGGGAGGAGGGANANANANDAFWRMLCDWNKVSQTVPPPTERRRTSVSENRANRSATMAKLLELAVNTGRQAAPQPPGLAVTARPFQLQAIDFMKSVETTGGNVGMWAKYQPEGHHPAFYYSAPLNKFSRTLPEPVRGGILASEMGLGKTVMALGLVLSNTAPATLPAPRSPAKVSSKGTLVVCAVSLVGQWIEEANAKLSNKNVKVYAYHSGNRVRDHNFLAQQDIVVTTYAVIASDATYWAKKGGASYVPPCEAVDWHRIVLDESHTIKAQNNKSTKAILAIKGRNKWCMSGTPFCTQPSDILSQLKFIGYNLLAERDTFKSGAGQVLEFAIPKFMIRHKQQQKIDGVSILQLPPKEEIVKKVKLHGQERTMYGELLKTALAKFKCVPPELLRTKTLEILSYLLPLRKACSGGELKGGGEAAAAALHECPICEDACEDPKVTKCGHTFCSTCITSLIESNTGTEPCPVCASDLTAKSLSDAAAASGGGGGAAATMAAPAAGASGGGAAQAASFQAKVKVLMKDLKRIQKENKKAKVLIFSQFAETLERLKIGLNKRGYGYRTLTGSMTRSQRTKALSDFQKDPPTTVFLLSTRAGAVGINLTQANHIFMMEPSFNEALEKQAIGRVYRMGQTRKVSVTRYVIENSIEENMLKVRSKRPDGENGDEGGSGEARALVVVGSITGEAKADAGGLDLAGLFGSADDMPAAGVDDDPEDDSDSDSDDDDDDEEEGGEVVNEEEEEDEEEDDAAVDEGEGVVQPGGGGAAAKATVATVVSTRPRRKRAAATAAAAVLAASTSAGAIGASDDDDTDFEIDDDTDAADDAADDDDADDTDDEEYTLPSGVAAATSMASSSSSSSRPTRKRAAAVAAVQPTSLAKPIRQKAKRFKVSAPKVQAGAASDDSDDAAEEEYTYVAKKNI